MLKIFFNNSKISTAFFGSIRSRSSTYTMIFFIGSWSCEISLTNFIICLRNEVMVWSDDPIISLVTLSPVPIDTCAPIRSAPKKIVSAPLFINFLTFSFLFPSRRSSMILLIILINASSGVERSEYSHELIQICLKVGSLS